MDLIPNSSCIYLRAIPSAGDAIAARNYLLQQGIQPERMTILPLGESKPKKPGNTSLEHAYNRRVEIDFQDLRGLEIVFEEQDSDLQLEQ